MPLDMSYESDSSDDGASTKATRSNNKAPSLADKDAFPETFGSAPAPAPQPSMDFASLAGKFVPEENSEFDLTQPRPVQRRVITRISRLRDMYYKSRDVCNQPLGSKWKLHVDSGLQGPEKSVECVSRQLGGEVGSTKQFDPVCAPLRPGVSTGSNVRLFKSSITSPSALDEALEQGGKWSLSVSKELSMDMFEELCLYVLDERLGASVDGCLLAVREGADVLSVWSGAAPSAKAESKMSEDIMAILGLEEGCRVEFGLHSTVYKKLSQARKYFCVEQPPRGAVVTAQEVSLQPRSKVEVTHEKQDKRKANKGKKRAEEGFITENNMTQRKPAGNSSEGADPRGSTSASTVNPFGDLEVEEEKQAGKKKNESDAPLVFKTRKANSRKGSKKGSAKDEFADLPVQQGSVVPLPIFMAAGGAVFLVLAIFIWTYTQSS